MAAWVGRAPTRGALVPRRRRVVTTTVSSIRRGLITPIAEKLLRLTIQGRPVGALLVCAKSGPIDKVLEGRARELGDVSVLGGKAQRLADDLGAQAVDERRRHLLGRRANVIGE